MQHYDEQDHPEVVEADQVVQEVQADLEVAQYQDRHLSSQ
jgi:hypothetical protein